MRSPTRFPLNEVVVVIAPDFALLAADGLWSTVRKRIAGNEPPRFAGRTAWRGLIAAREVAPEFREPLIHLWLGRDAHLVHYPVKAGRAINVVVITTDSWNAAGWSEPASRTDLIPRLAAEAWAPAARALVGLPEAWLKWALYDRRPLTRWSSGPVGLLGDAAHPMLPFLAQGAAMAIEDAAVLARCLNGTGSAEVAAALARYDRTRRERTDRMQLGSRMDTSDTWKARDWVYGYDAYTAPLLD